METDCGQKHLKWAGVIIGVVILVVGIFFGWANVRLSEFEIRLRLLEKSEAGNTVRYETIRDDLLEIKSDMKELKNKTK